MMLKRLLLFLFIPYFSIYADDLETVRPILDQYDRPFTVLSIGENKLISQIARECDATCVVAGPTKIEVLGTDQMIHLKKKLSFEDLLDLNRREHFDFIIAFHSLHDLAPWKSALHELFKLGDHLIIKISPETSSEAQTNPAIFGLARYLTNLGLTNYLDSDGNDHFLWYCFKPKSVHPYLYKGNPPKGITLSTYKKHQGAYPSREWIHKEKKKLPLWKRLTKFSIRTDGKGLN